MKFRNKRRTTQNKQDCNKEKGSEKEDQPLVDSPAAKRRKKNKARIDNSMCYTVLSIYTVCNIDILHLYSYYYYRCN